MFRKNRVFFPPRAESPQSRERREAIAKALCNTCLIREECLVEGIKREEYGIWGGINEDERAISGHPVPRYGMTRSGRYALKNMST